MLTSYWQLKRLSIAIACSATVLKIASARKLYGIIGVLECNELNATTKTKIAVKIVFIVVFLINSINIVFIESYTFLVKTYIQNNTFSIQTKFFIKKFFTSFQ